jgi:hypothetical protein
MSAPLFSINGAAEVLERDRRTVTNALRHAKPDAKQHGQPRWRLRTVLDALDELPGSSNAPRRGTSRITGDMARRIFKTGACYARANDALLALGDLPEDEDVRKAEFGRVFNLIEDLRSAFAEGEPRESEHQEVIAYMLGRMIKGLMHATGVRITDDDGTLFIAEKDICAYEPPAGDL